MPGFRISDTNSFSQAIKAALMKRIIYGLTLLVFAHCQAELRIEGKAYDIDTNELVYVEKHLAIGQQPSSAKVEYYSPTSKLIAEKHLWFNGSLQTPDFTLNVFTQGQMQGVKNTPDDKFEVLYQESADDDKQSKTIDKPANPVVDAGFVAFVTNNWNDLMNEKNVKFSFAAPTRQRFIDFEMQLYEQTKNTVTVKMSASSWLINLAVGGIYLTFDKDTKQLLQYKGLTNLPQASGENYRAIIKYQYFPSKT